jgi:uncharacterized protein YyaL (SSP411 family)
MSSAPLHSNRLAREKSPYLLQHAHNPVDWFPWGDEAFAKARAEGKPIFLSIGYSTCHWCHVMERESFETETAAAALNRDFVSIKVDREERPDVDKIYMTFVQATTGSGGWPMSVFLTPDLKPFYGGTYFPPEPRQGLPGFVQLATRIAELWRERRADLELNADQVHDQLSAAISNRSSPPEAPPSILSGMGGENLEVQSPSAGLRHRAEGWLQSAAATLKNMYDPEHGGFGHAPKFPQPSMPAFLLLYACRFGDDTAKRMVLHTCDHMAKGGIHDQLGGGFARYSVDAQWLVPHFEKMLYDNAQLAQLYLDAYLVSGDPRHADTARDILDYVLRDMTHPLGGFYSAEDADSEGHEGKFYCWTRGELSKLLGPEEFNVAARHFGITEHGNFVDHSNPAPLAGQNVLSAVAPVLGADDQRLLASAKTKMIEARARRIRPHLDDKVLVSWNGLMLGALARAYAVLGESAYRVAAERNLAFIQDKLWHAESNTLYHRWRDAEHNSVQLLDTYAFLLSGVLDLYEATLDPRCLDFAVMLAEAMLSRFFDTENGGFWQSAAGASDLILRMKDEADGAEPSGNSVATLALLRLAAIANRSDFRAAAEKTLHAAAQRFEQMPHAVPYLLQALSFWMDEPVRVEIQGDSGTDDAKRLLHASHSIYMPGRITLGGHLPASAPAATGKPSVVACVCAGQICKPPTSDPAELRAMLSR